MKCLFAHGFEGVPNGRKPRYLQGELGYTVTAPHMTELGWTFEDQVGILLNAIDADPELQLVVGSSMGAFALAVACTRRPRRDLRVVLMAPAVGLHRSWEKQLGDDVRLWEEMGTLQYFHQGVGKEVQLPWALFAQCRDNASVGVSHPLALVHGLKDDVVPAESALGLARNSSGLRRLYVVPDDHRLLNSLGVMAEAIKVVLG